MSSRTWPSEGGSNPASGPTTTTVNRIATWGNTTGTSLLNSNLTLSGNVLSASASFNFGTNTGAGRLGVAYFSEVDINGPLKLYLDGPTPSLKFSLSADSGGVTLTNDCPIFSAQSTNFQVSLLDTHGTTGIRIRTAGAGLQIKEGTNGTMGTATLSGGTVTVSTSAALTNSRIFAFPVGAGVGVLNRGTIVNGVSFVINSSDVTDARAFSYLIINPSA